MMGRTKGGSQCGSDRGSTPILTPPFPPAPHGRPRAHLQRAQRAHRHRPPVSQDAPVDVRRPALLPHARRGVYYGEPRCSRWCIVLWRVFVCPCASYPSARRSSIHTFMLRVASPLLPATSHLTSPPSPLPTHSPTSQTPEHAITFDTGALLRPAPDPHRPSAAANNLRSAAASSASASNLPGTCFLSRPPNRL